MESEFVTGAAPLVSLRAEIRQRGIAAASIVPDLDLIKDRGLGFLKCGIASVYTLDFQRGKVALHHGIVVAIPGAAHAYPDAIPLANLNLTYEYTPVCGWLIIRCL